jgi:hypothetical protein
MFRLFLSCTLLLGATMPINGQTAADSAAIRRAALDYIDGWYTGTRRGWSGRSIPTSRNVLCTPRMASRVSISRVR